MQKKNILVCKGQSPSATNRLLNKSIPVQGTWQEFRKGAVVLTLFSLLFLGINPSGCSIIIKTVQLTSVIS